MAMTARQIAVHDSAEIQQMRIDSERMAEDLLLNEWGKWQSNHGVNLWYKHVSPGFVPDSDGWQDKDLMKIIADIPDDVGMEIDAAISALPAGQRRAIILVYRERVPVRKLGDAMKTSRYIAEKALNQGMGMLWGMLKRR